MTPPVTKYLVKHIAVKGLWGRRHFAISFHKDINIIIGPNASGKTTLINLLHHALTANFSALSQLTFKSIEIQLQEFDGTGEEKVLITQSDESLHVKFARIDVSFPLGAWRGTHDASVFLSHSVRRSVAASGSQLKSQMALHVPAVWLPVSRRLPISDEEEADRRRLHRRPLESVDECLAELLEGLQKYRVSLDSQLSELRKEFQKHALEAVLYDKQHDRADWSRFTAPTEDDKAQLRRAFAELGLVDRRIEKRIDEHFAAAHAAATELQSESDGIDADTLLIIPLMNRTRSMVRFAHELEVKRTALFDALHSYERIVATFLADKQVDVDSKGQLILSEGKPSDRLEWRAICRPAKSRY